MTGIHPSTRRTRTSMRRPHRRRLPRLGWWWAAIAVTAISSIRTWPLISGALLTLAAALLILRATRPTRLGALWNRLDRITERRRLLPPRTAVRPLRLFQQMTPGRFENAIAELAREHPTVRTATAVGQANDRGADVLVHLKDDRRILIQCKKYRDGNNIGSETVQTINGVYRDIHHCDLAAIVTTANFTRSAIDTNAMLPRQLRLVDGHGLVAWANGGPPPW